MHLSQSLRLLPVVAIALLAGLALGWLWTERDGSDRSLSRVASSAELRIGYAVEAPYAVVTADGQVSGAAPELARLVGGRIGVKQFTWVQTSFDALIPDLLARRFDMVAAGMFITPERAGRVAQSQPTQKVSAGLLVRAGGNAGAAGPADLSALAKVAVIDGSVEQSRWLQAGLPVERLMVVPDAASGRSAVLEGLADALALSLPTVRWMAAHSQGRLVVRTLNGRDPLGRSADYTAFQFHPDDVALREAWDRAQSDVVGSAEHLGAVRSWGFGPDELPGRVTLDEVLAQ